MESKVGNFRLSLLRNRKCLDWEREGDFLHIDGDSTLLSETSTESAHAHDPGLIHRGENRQRNEAHINNKKVVHVRLPRKS